jgi:hypothetical protein
MSHCDKDRLKRGVEAAVKAHRERHMMAAGPAMASMPAVGATSVPAPVPRTASMSNGNFRMENVRSDGIPD